MASLHSGLLTREASTGRPFSRAWTTSLIAAGFFAPSVSAAVQTFFGQKAFLTVADSSGTGSLPQALANAGELAILVAAGTLVVGGWVAAQRPVRSPGFLLAAGILAFADTRSLFSHNAPSVLSAAAVASTVIIASADLGRAYAVRGIVGLAIFAIAGSLMAILLAPGNAFLTYQDGTAIGTDKAIFPGNLPSGIYDHPNTLAQILVLSLPAVFVGLKSVVRMVATAGICLMLVWTASRTAIVAMVVLLGVVLLRRLHRRSGTSIAVAAIVASAGVAVTLPLVTTDGSAFSGRGQIWMGSLEYWHSNIVFGLGLNWYSQIAQVANDLIPEAFHGHNLFITLGAECGLIGLLLFSGLCVVAVRNAVRLATERESHWQLETLVVLSILSIQEAPVVISGAGQFLYIGWGVLCMIATSPSRIVPRGEVTLATADWLRAAGPSSNRLVMPK